MEAKAQNPIDLLAGGIVPPLLQAYFELAHLKQLYRQGWLRRGVPRQRCESIAEHSFGVAMLALWLCQDRPELDASKVLRMALLHDLGEVYAGDIIPSDGVSADEKHRLEAGGVGRILSRLSDGQGYVEVWDEFEAGISPEARFVRQIDRLEMGLQAAVYQQQGLISGEEFFASARQSLTDPLLVALFDEIQVAAMHSRGKKDEEYD